MPSPPEIDFEPLMEAQLGLLHGWLQAPHVREFWDDGERTPEQVWTYDFERDVEAFVIILNGQKAGYIQAYEVGPDAGFAAFRAEVGDTWGIGLFIGEPRFVGRGHAASIVRIFVERLVADHPDLRRVLIDPETRTARAIHVYRTAGFVPLAVLELDSKQFQLMTLDLPFKPA